ncbi:MAG: hypothetical protein WDZ62_00250 [Candidatus Pacearchaeota archaeon]
MKKRLDILFLLVSILMTFIVLAQVENGQQDFVYDSFEEFYDQIPIINEEIQSRDFELPDSASFLMKEGNLLVNITNEISEIEFYVEVEDKKIEGIFQGTPEEINYIILTDEKTIESILESEDKSSEILLNYDRGNIKLKAVGFGNKVKLFFAKIVMKFV